MDDFVLLLENKEQSKIILAKIKEFLEVKLKLQLNEKTNYFKAKQGINFCGYKIYSSHILLRKNNKVKIKRKIKKWNKMYKAKELDMKKAIIQLNSWCGHAKNADTYILREKMKNNCDWIYK